MDLTELYGRRLLANRAVDDIPTATIVKEMATIEINSTTIRCKRCGQVSLKCEACLPRGHFYCPRCINLGRVSTLTKFYHVPEPNQFQVISPVLTWQGKLSPLQARAAAAVAKGMAHHDHQLLWAVTGAGKTEMMFQGIAEALSRGERVGLASPRVDVCLELYPRLQAAFANTEIVLLHGKQELPYRYAQLTICTTHQLLRFYHAFDNLIIDEVDAFPYASNEALIYATKQAVKPTGGCLYLTATPGNALLKRVRRRELTVAYLPLRYHGYLLPTIRLSLQPKWRKQLNRGQLAPAICRQLLQALKDGYRFLLFVPHINDLELVAKAVARIGDYRFATVHAADPQRLTKVQRMRDGEYDFLITTSILERGVTFPEIDVFVLGADDPVFSSSALVQIAGRAGRSKKRPTGKVIFWISSSCQSVRQAVKEIRAMNRKGRRIQRELSGL